VETVVLKCGSGEDFRPLRGCRFELFTMLTSAAVSGLGVALVRRFLYLQS
jgi:hypothetical protein